MYSLPLTGFPVWETVSWPQVLTCFSEVGSHLEIWKVSKGYGQSASCSWPPSSPHLSCLPRVLWEWKSPPRHLSFPQVSHSGEPPTLNCPGLFCAWTFRDKTLIKLLSCLWAFTPCIQTTKSASVDQQAITTSTESPLRPPMAPSSPAVSRFLRSSRVYSSISKCLFSGN